MTEAVLEEDEESREAIAAPYRGKRQSLKKADEHSTDPLIAWRRERELDHRVDHGVAACGRERTTQLWEHLRKECFCGAGRQEGGVMHWVGVRRDYRVVKMKRPSAIIPDDRR